MDFDKGANINWLQSFLLFDDFVFDGTQINPDLAAAKEIEAGVKIFGIFRNNAGDGELSPIASASEGIIPHHAVRARSLYQPA